DLELELSAQRSYANPSIIECSPQRQEWLALHLESPPSVDKADHRRRVRNSDARYNVDRSPDAGHAMNDEAVPQPEIVQTGARGAPSSALAVQPARPVPLSLRVLFGASVAL